MKKLFLLILLSLGLSAISYAGPYDDWPDDSICMWLDMKPTHAGYLGEAKKRGLSCEGGVAIKTSSVTAESTTTTMKKTQIEWVDGLYAKSITDEFTVLSKDFSKSVESGNSLITPLGWGDFSGDGIPELVYGIQYSDLKKGSNIKPIFLTNTPGKGFSLFKPIMDIAPYAEAPRSSVIEDFNGDGVNDIFIADHGVDYEPYPGYQNSLILSAPNGKFINATSNLPQILDFTHGVTSGDVDSDGDIDLFVAQNGINVNVPHYFLRNNGKGRFTKVPDGQLLDRGFSYISHQPGNKRRNFYFTPGLELVDDDDKLDLILLSGKLQGDENNRIIFGSNSGFKKSDALELQPGRFGKKSAGYNYLVTDIDNDGDNDILILHVTYNPLSKTQSNLGTDLQVLIQEKNRKFVDKSNFYFPGITFDYGTWAKSLSLIDINNDDKKDIVLIAAHGIDDPNSQQIGGQIKQAPPKVFIRQEDGSFRPLNNDLLTGGEKYTLAGIRPIDIDNDGDIEFVVQKNSEKGFTLQVLELTTNKEEAMYYTGPTEIISSPLFDGRYSFTVSRHHEDEGSKRLGNGYIEINNGIMTVAKDGRSLDTGSIDLYDSFKGQIDKKGNIVSSLKIDIMFGTDAPTLIDLYGSIDSQFQGKWKWNTSWEVILEFKKKAKEHTLFDGRYSFTLSRHHKDEGSKRLGNGYIEINNGIMTVAKEGRSLDTGSIDLYDSFEGQIDKQGNIISGSLNINIMFGEEGSNIVSLKGNKGSQFEGAWNNDWDVILKLGEKE